MVWYRKIFGAMNIARGVGSSFSKHLDPDEWLVQDGSIGRWQSASITMQNATNFRRTTVQSVDVRALSVTNAKNPGCTTFL